MVSPASRSCGYFAKTPPQQIHTPSILYVTLLGVWCWCTLAIHWYFWAPWFRWTMCIIPFYKGVISNVGWVSLFKDTHQIQISKKIKINSSWNSKNCPTFVGTFQGLCVYHIGFGNLFPMWFFGNDNCRRQIYGANSLEKGLVDLIGGVGEVLLLCFFFCRELVVAFK